MADLQLPHKLTLTDRKLLTLTAAQEVVSFDENAVVVNTTLGTLVIQGEGLQLKNLSPEGGQVTVAGHIAALSYQEARPAAGFFRRLLG